LHSYMSLYKKYFAKYPNVYLKAFIAQNLGWFYPFTAFDYPTDIGFPGGMIPSKSLTIKQTFNFIVSSFYFYLFILFLILTIQNKLWANFIILTPIILSLGVCFLSPVSGTVRYMLPAIVLIEILIVYCTINTHKIT